MPSTPQLWNNYRDYNNPLIAGNLYGSTLTVGMSLLKYGTTVIPNQMPQLSWYNPFYRGDIASPVEFLEKRPWGYLATLGLHIFGMLDQDYPFPYIAQLHPWHRWPLAMLNYLFWFGAAVGIGLWGRRCLRERRMDKANFACFSALLVGLFSVGVYVPSCPEIRYSLVLYFLRSPFVAGCLLEVARWKREKRWRAILAIGLAAILFGASWAWLSSWMDWQAPRLRI